jgi:hypothetical protein
MMNLEGTRRTITKSAHSRQPSSGLVKKMGREWVARSRCVIRADNDIDQSGAPPAPDAGTGRVSPPDLSRFRQPYREAARKDVQPSVRMKVAGNRSTGAPGSNRAFGK